jgi:DNA-binding GntR family transcriptional regulator
VPEEVCSVIESEATAKQEITVGTPAYQRVIDHIEAGIRAGLYPVDSWLPTIIQLAERAEASQTAVKTALLLLNQRGIVQGHQGKGTLVVRIPDQTSG